MKKAVFDFFADESGVTSVEYAMMAGAAAALLAAGDNVIYEKIKSLISSLDLGGGASGDDSSGV
ncbi:Flp family type IVb pilin [Sneathiella glossodoripedis]|uniref:Flp family type IVb pilin n=1 Tax=Sneathiella glossodoripedis TaxID=418853 RepID=UPI00131F2D1E|nr:Flp family type IVb pilin [Sneathiella glossodoripedis]